MNLEHLYTYPHDTTDAFEARQFVGPSSIDLNGSFFSFMAKWGDLLAAPDKVAVLNDGNRLVVELHSGKIVIVDNGDWVIDYHGQKYPSIVCNDYFMENYRPLLGKASETRRLNPLFPDLGSKQAKAPRLNVTGDEIISGPKNVKAFIERLVTTDRLPTETAYQLFRNNLIDDPDVCVQIFPAARDGVVFTELALTAPWKAPVSVRLNDVPGADQGYGESSVPYDAFDEMFDRFFQLMKVKHGEMGPIKMDHRTLMEALATTLTDSEDEDQFIKIAIYAMGLQEVGGFTTGQLLAADQQETPEPSNPDHIDLGEDFK